MAYEVKIEPAFADERMQEEFDDDTFMQTEMEFQSALKRFLEKGGARSDNVIAAIENVLNDEV